MNFFTLIDSFSPMNFQFLSIFGAGAFFTILNSCIGTSGKNSIDWKNKKSAPTKSVDFIGGQSLTIRGVHEKLSVFDLLNE